MNFWASYGPADEEVTVDWQIDLYEGTDEDTTDRDGYQQGSFISPAEQTVS